MKGSYAVDKNNTLSLEFLQGNNTLTTSIAPTGIGTDAMPTINPFFPGGPGLGGVPGTPADPARFDPLAPLDFVDWRTTVAGNRSSTFENKTDRILLDWVGQPFRLGLFRRDAAVEFGHQEHLQQRLRQQHQHACRHHRHARPPMARFHLG